MFDVMKMVDYSVEALIRFSQEHPDETCYVFCLDASLLCLNTLEALEETLKVLERTTQPTYSRAQAIEAMKEDLNPGDWPHQGFADLRDGEGFDMDLYDEHYNAPDSEQTDSEYAQAMEALLSELHRRKAFDVLRKTDDFRTERVEHNY